MRIKGLGEKRRIYFIGIGGVSMSALAKMLSGCGYRVSGYDAAFGRQIQKLRELGLKVCIGEEEDGEELTRAEAIVYTDAIGENDARLRFAKSSKKLLLSRADLLSMVSKEFDRVIAVAGSHGKTTCTAMCAHALKCACAPFALHVGGEDLLFDNFVMTGKDFLVTEACEYKKNLSKIVADSAVLLNIDNDHLECYASEAELHDTFLDYLDRARVGFICADDENCRRLLKDRQNSSFITFGVDDINLDYTAVDVKKVRNGYSFWVVEYGKRLCKVVLSVPGRHNVYNALAAFTVLRSYGFDEKEIVKGLQSFKGVKRRFERVGKVYGCEAIADYAHHPREIVATLHTARESVLQKGRLFVVFQPHTYSRTKLLMEEFVSALSDERNLVIYRSFSARENFDEAGSAKSLSAKLKYSIYADNIYALDAYLKATLKEGDAVLFLGAGDIYAVAQHLSRDKG